MYRIVSWLFFAYKFAKSFVFGFLFSNKFRDIKNFCMFIGYPRSGHSLIGALIDAHPDAAISMEWNVLYYFKYRYSKNQLFYSIRRNSQINHRKKKNVWTGYSYAVPNMWQGRYRRLELIGDKLGGRTALMLANESHLLDKFVNNIGIPVKIIHIIRNPFDNITTMARRFGVRKFLLPPEKTDLESRIEPYFERVTTIQKLKESKKYSILDIYHEDFIAEPKKELEKIINYLGLQNDENYLNACSKIVYKNPHLSRNDVFWPENLKQMVQEKISSVDFLRRYSFDH